MFSPAGPQLVPLLHASSSPDTWKGQICLIQVHVCPPGVNVNMPFTGLQRPGAVGGGHLLLRGRMTGHCDANGFLFADIPKLWTP